MTPEPAQPAESPEARALTILDVPPVSPPPNSNGILCFACGKRVEHTSAGYCFSCIATFNVPDAATTARPTERGAVEALLRQAANLVYRIEAAGAVEHEGSNFDKWKATARALAPDLRATLTPPVTVAATDQAGEALARRFHETYERLAPSFGYETRTETREFDPATPNGKLMIAVCAALATQPATGRTMGGEVEEAASMALMYLQTGVMECERCGFEISTADLDATYELAAVVKPASDAALQNGGE